MWTVITSARRPSGNLRSVPAQPDTEWAVTTECRTGSAYLPIYMLDMRTDGRTVGEDPGRSVTSLVPTGPPPFEALLD